MRNLFICVLSLMAILTSCQKEETTTPDIAKGTEYNVNFAVQKNGINISSESMSGTKAVFCPEKDIIAIQIKKKSDNSIIACGLFFSNINFSTLNVSLQHGIEYTVEATYVKDYEKHTGYGKDTNSDRIRIVNVFSYQTIHDAAFAWTGSEKNVFTDLSSQGAVNSCGLCEGDRWYYKHDITGDALAENKTIAIDLKRVSFRIDVTTANYISGTKFMIGKKMGASDINDAYQDLNTYNKLVAYVVPDISAVYGKIINEQEPTISENFDFAYRVINNKTSAVLREESKAITGIKANYNYKITIDGSVNSEYGISMSINDEWVDSPIELHND